jgi:hypothetical protein
MVTNDSGQLLKKATKTTQSRLQEWPDFSLQLASQDDAFLGSQSDRVELGVGRCVAEAAADTPKHPSSRMTAAKRQSSA